MNELVLFGVTGDLARQKLIPSLYNLYNTGKINEKSSFIGFGRKNFSKIEFQAFIEEILHTHFTKYKKQIQLSDHKNQIRNFSAQWSYIESELDDVDGYKKLASSLQTNSSIIYVSLPPKYQYQVVSLLFSAQVIKKNVRKIALEKPYGSDTESALKLDQFLTKKIKEDQILRVDHYAGKQSLVEIESVARQGVFKHILSNRTIKKIEIKLNESIDIGSRGVFYDSVGALSDIGQNHVLHMLATILAIPERGSTEPCSLAHLRGEVITLLELSKLAKHKPVLGQYETFNRTVGVDENSLTETFFRVYLNIKKDNSSISKRWAGTQIELMGGKALDKAEVSIKLILSNNQTSKIKRHSKKMLRSTIPENECITIPVNGYGQRDAYEQIFLDMFEYNPDRFVDFRQIKSGWSLIEKIKKVSNINKKNKPVIYKKGVYPQDIL